MRGRIITSDHRIFELPVLLRWNITYTGGVPCDSYEVTCVYDRTMAELLHLAAGFLALDENGGVLLRGIVDEYEVKLTAAGLTVVDFKTDRVLTDAEVRRRAEQYRPQLEAYSRALERVLEKKVVRRALYFLAAGETMEI